jgi:hypothetical protein
VTVRLKTAFVRRRLGKKKRPAGPTTDVVLTRAACRIRMSCTGHGPINTGFIVFRGDFVFQDAQHKRIIQQANQNEERDAGHELGALLEVFQLLSSANSLGPRDFSISPTPRSDSRTQFSTARSWQGVIRHFFDPSWNARIMRESFGLLLPKGKLESIPR